MRLPGGPGLGPLPRGESSPAPPRLCDWPHGRMEVRVVVERAVPAWPPCWGRRVVREASSPANIPGHVPMLQALEWHHEQEEAWLRRVERFSNLSVCRTPGHQIGMWF